MIEDNQKEDWRQYNTSKEFSKDIKFNKKWYHLSAIFDQDQDNFDFNELPDQNEFDFNNDILDQTNEYEPNQYIDSVKFDFNSVLMEKYKITEIGLIMSKLNESTKVDQSIKTYDIEKIVENKDFIKFYDAINTHQFNGFYVKTSLEVFNSETDDSIASINDESKFKTPEISKDILSTLLKSAGGYANQSTIHLLSDLNDDDKPKNYKSQNVIQLLSNLIICNNTNPMEFPDAIFPDDKYPIPVDLKVAYKGRISIASGRNVRYMSGIYNALLGAIDAGESLIDYIKHMAVGIKHDEKTDNIIGLEMQMMPELKGFLLISSTFYNRENKRLEYSGICIRPLIACMHGRTNRENDPLFASKDGKGHGAIAYDNGWYEEYDEGDSILNGCPIRFANVIKNFYDVLIHNNGITKEYGDLKMFLTDDIIYNELFNENINKIAKYIGLI